MSIQYKDPDVVRKIKEATHDSIHVAFDTISEAATQTLTAKTFGPGPGKEVVILTPQKEAQAVRGDVEIQRKSVRHSYLGIGITKIPYQIPSSTPLSVVNSPQASSSPPPQKIASTWPSS